jgi:hypothetical protein
MTMQNVNRNNQTSRNLPRRQAGNNQTISNNQFINNQTKLGSYGKKFDYWLFHKKILHFDM